MHSDPQHTFTARYGDGLSAQRIAASVRLDGDGVAFQFPGVPTAVWPYTALRSGEPVRSRSVDAVITAANAGRASLYVDDAHLLAEIVRRAPHLKLGRGRWRAAQPGLLVGAVALAAYAGITVFDLSPAKGLASAMPVKARAALGERVLKTMPAQRQCTGAEGRRALGVLMRRLMPNGPMSADSITILDWRLLNAFAVPGNRIVLTRQIIERARSADEVAAIIGHEAGHANRLDPEASLVRSVGFWALVQMMFTGTPGAIGNIGSMLAQLGYTRSAERAADDYALRLLRDAGISAQGMADFFRRAETKKPAEAEPQPDAASDIFASHPSNAERISSIENRPSYPATPALSAEDWEALKTICARLPEPAPARTDATARPEESATAKAAAEKAAEAKRAEEIKRAEDIQRAAAANAAATEKAAAEVKSLADAKAAAERVAAADHAAANTKRLADAKAAADHAAANAKRLADAKRDEDARAAAEKAAAQAAANAPVAAPVDPRIEAATQRIAANDKDAIAYFERGQAYAAQRRHPEAIDDFSRSIALQPTDTAALLWRASLYTQLKQPDLAIADYTEVLRLQPKSYAAYNNRGSVYRTQKKPDQAIKDFTAAIALDGKQPMALTNRALAYRDKSNLDAAIADLNTVVAANPKYANALVRRGETFELKAQKDAALADYRAVLKLPEPSGGASEPHRTARARLQALSGQTGEPN